MPKTYGALIEREPVVSTAAVETYTSPFDASQKVDKTTYDALKQDFNATQAQKSEVGAISTKDAISQINKQKGYLDTTYPPFGTSNEGLQKWANQDPEAFDNYADSQGYSRTPVTEGKAYFTNQMGQEAEYTEEQLKDPATRQFLTDNGFALVKSDGVNVGSDFSTSQIQSGVNQASALVENLTKDFLNYNVDQDPDFQAQSASIKAEFDRLRRQMEKTNYQRAQAFRTLGMRSGATQYAEGLQMGVEGEELNQANQRLADIASEEAATISAARSAFKSNKFSEFNNKVTALRDLRDQKQKELENYNTAIANYTKKLQEEEQASIEQQKFEFEVYKFEEEMKMKKAEGKKPLVVSPGSSIYDPDTMEFLGTAPEPPDTDAPSLETWGGQVHQWNPRTGTWETIGSENEYGDNTPMVLDWANQVASGARKFSDVPEELKNAVNSAIAKLPPKQADVQATQAKITKLDELINHPGMDESVGATKFTRLDLMPFTGAKSDFIGSIQELLSEKTLQSLIDAKAEGATFGALSEGELKILQSAASRIGSWVIKDDNGNVVGYKTSEKAFKDELNRIKSEYDTLLKTTAGQETAPNTLEQKIDDYYLKNPGQRQYIDSLESAKNPKTGQPYTSEEKAQLLGISFNSVRGDTKIASNVAKIPDGSSGGQCGRFVNKLTGLGVGDSYKSKLQKMDWSIKEPAPGMVFVMPSNGVYSEYGHVGIILAVNNGIATVKDSNWKGDERVRTHKIPVSKMTGFTYPKKLTV